MRQNERVVLLRWTAWFFLLQALLVAALSSRYAWAYSWPEDALARSYTLAAFLGHSALLALAPWLVIVIPALLIVPQRVFVQGLSVLLSAVVLAFVLTDSLVFAQDRFHIDALSLRVLGVRTWGFSLVYFAIFLAFCGFAAGFTSRRLARPRSGRWAAAGVGVLAAVLICAQAMHAWADAQYYVPITGFTPYLPLYRPLTAKALLSRWMDSADVERARANARVKDLAAVQGQVLDYPKQPLHCVLPAKPLSVLLIGLDSMRFDMAVPRVAPNIARFGEQAVHFNHHWSGGNGTRPGLFSLFYGIPSTYYQAFYAAQQAPVLIETFQREGYEVGVFPSNPPDELVGLDRTAFRSIPNLPQSKGDVQSTKNLLQFLETRDPAKPFFGFVFYEAAPGGCRPEYPRPEGADLNAPGELGRKGCYETALHFADGEVGKILADVERRGLFENTVVIVTSDHGEEFDESGLGFKGHGSGYSQYQLHTPFLVRWPGRAPEVIERRTSHHDVAPTLLSEVLGCDNPPSDYSSGGNMFANREWPWIVAASYNSLAVIEPDQITVSYGSYSEVRDAGYRLVQRPEVHGDVVSAALRETSRFFRR